MSQPDPPHHSQAPRTALELLQDRSHVGRLSFGCQLLDGRFRGGIPLHGITEFSGMAGSGKTQMVLHLLLQQQRPMEHGGLGGGKSFYLSTEGAFPSSRLAQMASLSGGSPSSTTTTGSMLDRVILYQATTVDEQVMILCSKLPAMLADPQHDIRMVVVDSVSALFRGEYSGGKEDSLERAKIIFTMGKQMKKLSAEFAVPFIVTNQVSADFAAGSNGAFGSSAVTPTLGLSWSTCINTRFLLSRYSIEEIGGNITMDQQGQDGYHQQNEVPPPGGQQGYWVREVRVALSPCMPKDTSCRFVIDARGIHGEEGDEMMMIQ